MNHQDPFINYFHKNVYTPSDDTYLLIDYFREIFQKKESLEHITNILDMGTGTGIIGIFFTQLMDENQIIGSQVYASDILIEAIECAKKNELKNNLFNQIIYIHSDLFNSFPDSLKHAFDLIIFNPPYLPSLDLEIQDSIHKKNKKDKKDYSWDGGPLGSELIKKFLNEAPSYLRVDPKSSIYYITSSRMDLESLNTYIQKKGLYNKILRSIHIFFEDIILNRINPYF